MHTIREALIAMGYSEKKPGKWAKPIGYQLFTYNENNNLWTNWFVGVKGNDIKIFASRPLGDPAEYGTYLSQLKSIECYTRTDIAGNIHAELHLDGIDI